MNWQTKTTSPATGLTNSATTTALKTELAGIESPSDLSAANPNQGTAASDDRSALIRVGILETLAVTPWSDGIHSGTKRSASFYISAADAQNKMATMLAATGWQSAFVVMALADSESQLLEALQQIHDALPTPETAQAIRRAKSLADHESQKRFTPGEKVKTKAKRASASIAYDQTAAAQNIATVQAIASDTPPATILSEFIQRRQDRLQQIADATAPAPGTIQHSMKITGDLKAAMESATPQNPQAPLTVIIAIGGTAEQMNALYEVTGL